MWTPNFAFSDRPWRHICKRNGLFLGELNSQGPCEVRPEPMNLILRTGGRLASSRTWLLWWRGLVRVRPEGTSTPTEHGRNARATWAYILFQTGISPGRIRRIGGLIGASFIRRITCHAILTIVKS